MIFLFSSLEQKTKGAAGGEGQQGERPAECKQQWGATLHILQTMVLEVWFCLMQCHWVGFVEPMGGVRWLWNLWGNFSGTWCHMLVVLSLAVLGFRYYVLCLCFEWSLLPVWYLIAHTSGIACCTFMKRVAEKFCSREKASILPDCWIAFYASSYNLEVVYLCYCTSLVWNAAARASKIKTATWLPGWLSATFFSPFQHATRLGVALFQCPQNSADSGIGCWRMYFQRL
jgi:hypothetical protein